VSQNKRGGISGKTPFQRLEAAVEKAAQMISRHAGIPGIPVERELRSALRDFKRASAVRES
jgi:hypothetical protein